MNHTTTGLSRTPVLCALLFTVVYLSTPNLLLLSPLGILDGLGSTALALGVCYFALALPRAVSVPCATLVLSNAIAFNIGSRYYVEQQQTLPSAHSLYLVAELHTLLGAFPTTAIAIVAVATLVTLFATGMLVSRARPRTSRARCACAAGLLLAGSGLQLSYAFSANEANTDVVDSAPLGYLLRSSGYVPFARPDDETAAMRERQALIQRLRTDPEVDLPEKYSADSLAELLGRTPHRRAVPLSGRYPLLGMKRPSSALAKTATAANSPPRNVILIVLESVRASEMGLYGATESATPFLDSLAAETMFARRFYANANFTVKSEHSLHCSALDHMIGPPLAQRGRPVRAPCLPRMLKDRGYRTVWFHGNTKEFYDRADYLPRIGFGEVYSRDELDPKGTARTLGWGMTDPDVFDAALDRLEGIEEPFFAEILTLSNHMPFAYDWGVEFPKNLRPDSTMYQRYRRGIYYTDLAVRRFYERFLGSRLADDTLLVITGDHGIWTFPEDGRSALEKNEQYYRVPLIVRTPDGLRGEITDPASHLDIAPTLAALLGVTVPDRFMGRDLMGGDRPDRIVYMTAEHALSYRHPERACVPAVLCRSTFDCARDRSEENPRTMCYALRPDQDLLDDPNAVPVQVERDTRSRDRALFDYSQIALELGAEPARSLNGDSLLE